MFTCKYHITPLAGQLFISIALAASLIPGNLPATQVLEKTVDCTFSPYLSCYDSHNQQLLWSKSRHRDPLVLSSNQSRLYIADSTTTASYELTTGELIWEHKTGNDARYFYPVLDAENLFLARTDGFLEKRRADTGQLLWSRKLARGWIYPPLVMNEKLITGGQDRLLWVLDTQSGKQLDTLELEQELVAPLFHSGDKFISSTFDNRLQAFSIDDAGLIHPHWSSQQNAPAFSYQVDSQNLITLDMGGHIRSIDPKTGATRWHTRVHSNARFWARLKGQTLFTLTDTGTLSQINVADGRTHSSHDFNRQFRQAPIVRDDYIVIYDTSGTPKRISWDTPSSRNPSLKTSNS